MRGPASASPVIDSTTRTAPGPDDAAEPPFISGFGSVMEQEREIRSSTEEYLEVAHGPKPEVLNRILRYHQSRIGANIALLEERYQSLPQPARFRSLQSRPLPIVDAHHAAQSHGPAFLPSLVSLHVKVLRSIDALTPQRPDGQCGELILAEIARNHEDMAWMLTALIRESESVRDLLPAPIVSTVPPSSAGEASWENEGGAPRPAEIQPVQPPETPARAAFSHLALQDSSNRVVG